MRALLPLVALCFALGGCASPDKRPAPLMQQGDVLQIDTGDELRWRERYAYMSGYGPFGRVCAPARVRSWGPPWNTCY